MVRSCLARNLACEATLSLDTPTITAPSFWNSSTSDENCRASDVQPAPGLVVADLSFISLKRVVAPLAAVAAPGADVVLLVKPQFEVGRDRLGSGGVVRTPSLRRDAVLGVLEAAAGVGMVAVDVLRSLLPGPSGNVEYLVRFVAPGVAEPIDRLPAGRVDSVVLEEGA